MLEKISLAKIAPKYAKVRKASPETLSRTHYLKFLKEEQNFFASSDKLGYYVNEWSLKAVPQFAKSLVTFTKMAAEKAKSVYYVLKK